jgi:hypothetical protein
MNELEGKTVARVVYSDPWDAGLTITFTDGTVLVVQERTQSGEIQVSLNDKVIKSDQNL